MTSVTECGSETNRSEDDDPRWSGGRSDVIGCSRGDEDEEDDGLREVSEVKTSTRVLMWCDEMRQGG